MKYYLVLLTIAASLLACNKKTAEVVKTTYTQEIENFQSKEKRTYMDALNVFGDKVFTDADFDFFPINDSYKVVATLTKTPETEVFNMPTSGTKTPRYRAFGTLNFNLMGEAKSLIVYENLDLKLKSPEYADYLFCPFYDWTNGEQTYGGGRYMDFTIPEDNTLIIDFNKCYNPYCAYADKFNCPIPPRENRLEMEILAGMMYKGENH